ncbi:MAG: hypothetical protein RIB84_24530 [Sneathiellaceae bacterium]
MEHRYRSWIPNVTGNLSFSVFGTTQNPTRAITQNSVCGSRRYLICFQRRNLRDDIFHGWKDLPFGEVKGSHWFLVVAHGTSKREADDIGALEGRMYFFIDRRTWKPFREPIKVFQDTLRRKSQDPRRVDFSNDYMKIFEMLDCEKVPFVYFYLDRSGTCSIHCDPDVSRLHALLPELPDTENYRSILDNYCAQHFFFLRDIGHRHQHHADRTDTIVNLVKCCENDDLSWRREVLFSIYRKIITLKRQPSSDIYNRSIGMLAYAISARKTFMRELNKKHFDSEIPEYYDDEMKLSIEATSGRLKTSTQYFRSFWKEIVTLSAAIISIFMASVVTTNALYAAKAIDLDTIFVSHDGVFFEIFRFIVQHSLALAFFIFSAGIIVSAYTNRIQLQSGFWGVVTRLALALPSIRIPVYKKIHIYVGSIKFSSGVPMIFGLAIFLTSAYLFGRLVGIN